MSKTSERDVIIPIYKYIHTPNSSKSCISIQFNSSESSSVTPPPSHLLPDRSTSNLTIPNPVRDPNNQTHKMPTPSNLEPLDVLRVKLSQNLPANHQLPHTQYSPTYKPYDEPFLPTPPPESNLPASQATVYLPTPIIPECLEYARKRFRRVIVTGEMDQVEAWKLADGICKSVFVIVVQVSFMVLANFWRKRNQSESSQYYQRTTSLCS